MRQILKSILILLGVVIIFWVAFYLRGAETVPGLFWLNTIVVVVVYLTNAINLFSVFSSRDTFRKTMAGIGIHYFFSGLYSILALAGIWVGHLCSFEPGIQMIYQVVFLAFLLWGYFFAFSAMEQAEEAQGERQAALGGVASMREQTDEIISLLQRNTAASRERAQVADLQEKLQYISGSSQPKARELEDAYLAELRKIRNLSHAQVIDEAAFNESCRLCHILLEERKRVLY